MFMHSLRSWVLRLVWENEFHPFLESCCKLHSVVVWEHARPIKRFPSLCVWTEKFNHQTFVALNQLELDNQLTFHLSFSPVVLRSLSARAPNQVNLRAWRGSASDEVFVSLISLERGRRRAWNFIVREFCALDIRKTSEKNELSTFILENSLNSSCRLSHATKLQLFALRLPLPGITKKWNRRVFVCRKNSFFLNSER